MKTKIKYKVFAVENNDKWGGTPYESEPMDTLEECQRWVNENLPYGVLKGRTGTYEIVEIPSV